MPKLMRPPTKSLTELSKRLRKKIVLEPETAGEKHACWLWTGSFVAPRQRFKHYPVPDDREKFTENVGSIVNDRGTPNAWSKEMGYAVPANRVIYAECHGIPIRDVPRLERCRNERCVSPWHGRVLGAVPNRRAIPEPIVEPQPGGPSFERTLAILKHARPYAGMTPESAAVDAELKPEDVTPEVWRAYQAWDAEQPPDED